MKTDRASSSRRTLLFGVQAMALASVVGCGARASSGTSAFDESAEEPVAAVSPILATPATQAPERTNPIGTGEVANATFVNVVGGSIAMSDGTQMIIPAGALHSELGTLTMTSSTEPASNEIVAVTPTYTFGPTEGSFAKPVRIYIPVNLPDGVTVADLTILWTRSAGEDGFEELPTTFLSVDGAPRSFLAVADVKRFGAGAAGYRPLPPSAATITPN